MTLYENDSFLDSFCREKVFKDLSGVIAGPQSGTVLWDLEAPLNLMKSFLVTELECNVNSVELTPSGPMKSHYGCFGFEFIKDISDTNKTLQNEGNDPVQWCVRDRSPTLINLVNY